MQLSPTAFAKFLNFIGQDFDWRSAYACPCVNPHSGQANPQCQHCWGKGRFWSEPVTGMAGIVGRSQLKKFSEFGPWDDGDVLLSIPYDSPLYDVGQYDRLSAVNKSEPFSINIVAGISDTLRFVPISIDRVFFMEGTHLIEIDPPDVDPGGVLQWHNGRPPSRVTYSITGRRVPEYYVYMDMPFDRPFHAGAQLPRRVVIRRFDLYGR